MEHRTEGAARLGDKISQKKRKRGDWGENFARIPMKEQGAKEKGPRAPKKKPVLFFDMQVCLY